MNISPSSLARVVACPGSAILPQTGSTSAAALRGTAIHEYLAARTRGIGRDIALLMIPEEWREAAADLDPADLPNFNPLEAVAELAVAWDLETDEVRELARGGKLSREQIRALARDGEMVGIFDYVWLTEAAAGCLDWKSGFSVVDRAEVNWQVGAGAVMLAKLFKRGRSDVEICRLAGDIFHDRASFDELDLDSIETEIRAAIAKVREHERAYRANGVLPKLQEGPQCRYCPAFSHCGAKVALAKSILSPDGQPPSMIAALPVPLSNEDAVRLWPQLLAAEDLVKKLKGTIREIAQREPLHLGNGNLLAEVENSKSSVIAERLKSYVDSGFYEEVVQRKETVTKESIEDALKRRKAPSEKITHLKRQFFDGLEKQGGLKTSVYRSVEEVPPTSKKLVANNEPKAA